MQSKIKLRKVNQKDCETIFQWRNAIEIRQFSVQKNEIDFQTHQRWFQNKLADQNCLFLLAELDSGEPLGVVRYDIDQGEAFVSVYLAPVQIGKGYGALLLKAAEEILKQQYREVTQVVATILPQNQRSLGLFSQLGFVKKGQSYCKKIGSS